MEQAGQLIGFRCSGRWTLQGGDSQWRAPPPPTAPDHSSDQPCHAAEYLACVQVQGEAVQVEGWGDLGGGGRVRQDCYTEIESVLGVSVGLCA